MCVSVCCDFLSDFRAASSANNKQLRTNISTIGSILVIIAKFTCFVLYHISMFAYGMCGIDERKYYDRDFMQTFNDIFKGTLPNTSIYLIIYYLKTEQNMIT